MADGREGEGLDVGREGDEGAVLGRGAGGQRRSVEPDDRVGRVVGAAGVAVCEVEEVDEVDVAVLGLGPAVEDGVGRLDLARAAGVLDARRQAHDLGLDGELLAHLAQHGLNGVLAELDVAAGGEPGAELAVPVEGDAALVDDEAGDGEVALHMVILFPVSVDCHCEPSPRARRGNLALQESASTWARFLAAARNDNPLYSNRLRSKSRRVGRTRSAAGKGGKAVLAARTWTASIPAAFAAAMPVGVSSMATQRSGATPRRSAARR